MFSQRIICRSWQQYCNHSKTKISILHHSKLIQNSTRNIKNSRIKYNADSQSKGISPTPFTNIPNSSGYVSPSQIGKALVFGCTFSVGCFLGVTVWEYENVRKKLIARGSYTPAWLNSKLERKAVNNKSELQKEIEKLWSKLTPGEKVFVPICALNLIVFGLWRIPRLQNTMMTYFCSNPAGRAVCWPMFLSTFSHYSFFHIFANMYVLHSFSSAAVLSLGKEQFLGLYLSAGVMSSLASYMLKAATSQAGLSLGASGAIMAILAYVCCQFPDTELGILFLPMFTFSAGAAIKVIMGIDLAGCLLGWKFFDHAAHLGGSLFGIFWALLGKDHIWPKREQFLRIYHDLRTSK